MPGKAQVDVCLVSMPLAPPQLPSPGLGLLQAVLKGQGISTRSFYANLWFLEFVGAIDCVQLNIARASDSLLSWLFGSAAFPDHQVDHDQFLTKLMERNSNLGERDPEPLKERLLEFRRRVPEFVDRTAERILEHRPRIVGCTSMFQQHAASLALLRRVRELDPEVITLMGGANCETVMGQTTHRNFPWVDYVVSGEAEGLITGLVHTLLSRGRAAGAGELPEGVFGPVHRTAGYPRGDSLDGLPRARVPSLAGSPPPDYDDYFDQQRSSPLGNLILPAIPYEMSRGCWWGQCVFCGLNGCGGGGGGGYRSKPAEQVLSDLETLSERYGTTKIAIVDNALGKERFSDLIPRLASSETRYSLFFEVRADLSAEQVELLAAAGGRWLNPGIESLHDEALRFIDKGTSVAQNVLVLKWCRQFGIAAGWNLLFGFPGEKDEWYAEMAKLMPLLHHLPPPFFLVVRPCRYSAYVRDPERYGLKLRPSELSRMVWPLDEEDLARQVYHFEDENTPASYAHLNNRDFPGRPGLQAAHDAVARWRKAWVTDKALLCVREVDGVLEVVDERECATAPRHRIERAGREVLEACEEGPVAEDLVVALAGRGVSAADAQEALADLVARKLVLALSGRLVALPLKHPVPELPKASAHPTGVFLPRMFHRV